jgi:AraC-like DNA-binding protein/mannose-6-phosphate isomerase-like protein (cupin superfamily)
LDVLSSVLREMRFDSAGYRSLELHAPWGISFHQEGLRGVHIVVRGRCEIVLEGGPARVLETGDLVVAPRADPHVLRSVGDRRVPVISASAMTARAEGGHVRGGGTGEETIIVCGAFIFHEADHPALAALPRLIHVPGEGGRVPKWLAGYIDALTSEASEEGPGSDVVMARLSGALVARALRFHVEKADEPGWLKGLQDPQVARALAVIHDDFKRPWTLVSLAKAAGLSRAAFAARFTDKVGDAPMRYLLRCRMRHAMAMLRDKRATLASIAEEVGYGSEAALSVAFKRHTGLAPGAYRRAEIRKTQPSR